MEYFTLRYARSRTNPPSIQTPTGPPPKPSRPRWTRPSRKCGEGCGPFWHPNTLYVFDSDQPEQLPVLTPRRAWGCTPDVCSERAADPGGRNASDFQHRLGSHRAQRREGGQTAFSAAIESVIGWQDGFLYMPGVANRPARHRYTRSTRARAGRRDACLDRHGRSGTAAYANAGQYAIYGTVQTLQRVANPRRVSHRSSWRSG